MRSLITLFFFVSLLSCGLKDLGDKPVSTRPRNDTGIDFASAIATFETKNEAILGGNVDVSYIAINFGDTKAYGASVVGVCLIYGDGSREILIDRNFWDAVNDTYRYVLMAHELGHCHFNYGHRDTTLGGHPLSIMASYLISDLYYAANPNEYDEELALNNNTSLLAALDPDSDGVLGLMFTAQAPLKKIGDVTVLCPMTDQQVLNHENHP